MAKIEKDGRNSGKTFQKRKGTQRKKFDRDSRSDSVRADSGTRVRDNDPSWYLVNGQLAKDVADFSFNNAVGDPVRISMGPFSGLTSAATLTYREPGIASVLAAPTVGIATDATSPVNVAMRNIYSFVRHANSGHANYDPADLMIYLLAADSVQSYWSYLVRLYGVTQTFSQRNRYVGDVLIRSMGVDPTSIRANIAELRAYINQFAIKASVLAVPATMSYFRRHAWMFQNVYLDEDNPKAQMFLYVPAYLYRFTLINDAGALTPEWVSATNGNTRINSGLASRSFGDLTTIGDRLLNSMLSQEDVGIMSGDILKAYGSTSLYQFAQIDASYSVVPTFSEEVLLQFHNTNLVGRLPAVGNTTSGFTASTANALDITQDTTVGGGCLKFTPYFAGCAELGYGHILDTWHNETSPEESVVATRNMTWAVPVYKGINVGDTTYSDVSVSYIQTTGSELFFDIAIFVIGSDGSPFVLSVKQADGTAESFNNAVLGYSSKFNEFPLLRSAYITSDGAVSTAVPYGEISNYTVLSLSELEPLHLAATLSMFGVPYKW